MSDTRAIVEVAWCPLDDDSYGLMYKREGDFKWNKIEIVETEQAKALFEEEECECGVDWDKIHKCVAWTLIGTLAVAVIVALLW